MTEAERMYHALHFNPALKGQYFGLEWRLARHSKEIYCLLGGDAFLYETWVLTSGNYLDHYEKAVELRDALLKRKLSINASPEFLEVYDDYIQIFEDIENEYVKAKTH